MSEAAARGRSLPVVARGAGRFWPPRSLIAVLPLVLTGSYWHTNLTVCAINVLLALGLDFILGYAGQLNLGQSAFYGLGAYVSTLLITKLGVPFWVAFVAGVAFAGTAGMFLALFAVRLRGHYLAIASLGFAVIVHQILLNWISLTQGPLGIYAIPPPPAIAIPGLPVIDFRNPVALFYLVAGFALLVYFLLDQLVRSPDRRDAHRDPRGRGLGLLARHQRHGLEGVRLRRRRGGRRRGGLLLRDLRRHAGAGRVLHHRSPSPSSSMVIVGGMGTLIGPVFGAILLTLLPELLARHRRPAPRRLRRRRSPLSCCSCRAGSCRPRS